MKKIVYKSLLVIGTILFVWLALTVWVQVKGPKFTTSFGIYGDPTALLIYDPDPIYDLDKQVCVTLGEVLSANGFYTVISTVAAIDQPERQVADLYVFCANTYNWNPDLEVTTMIKKLPIKDKKTIAITLGSGSTERSQQRLEEIIQNEGAILIDSRSFWLLRPNDESRLEEPNVAVALDQVKAWGHTIARQVDH